MDKLEVLAKIKEQGVVSVVRGKDAEDGIRIADACIAGGVKIIEVAFTTPRAQETIHSLADKYKDDPDVVIGAGTVLDEVTARIAILEGAQFIVSPAFNLATVRLCNRYRIAVMPGTTTLNGVTEALEAGADVIKIFPGEIVGLGMVKAIHGPLPQAQIMPTGGVNAENVGDWLRAGCIAVGAGGSLTGAAKTGDFAAITAQAERFVEAVAAARAMQ